MNMTDQSIQELLESAKRWRADFPIIQTKTAQGHALAYLDNAATSQKPQAVIDVLTHFYATENANVHRGVYQLSEHATERFEQSRATIGKFIGSPEPKNLVLTHGATEAFNCIAHSYFRDRLQNGDEIILSIAEHHANIVPWQQLAKEKGCLIHYIPLTSDGQFDMQAYDQTLSTRTKLVAVTHVSNVLGTIFPIKKITQMAHAMHAKVLVDGAQACPQIPVDVSELGCDFYIASSHKCYAPAGVGCFYAKPECLAQMTPYQTGGSMIQSVTTEGATFMPPPMRFEAGTPAIAETIAWASACDYLQAQNTAHRLHYKQLLTLYLMERLQQMPHITVYGAHKDKVPVAAFTHAFIHPHDLASILDGSGVAVRAGHHCAMPLHQALNIAATTRASLTFYNNTTDIDRLILGIKQAEEIFNG
jgi:cysteine desulfurase/selenocysteine lyase